MKLQQFRDTTCSPCKFHHTVFIAEKKNPPGNWQVDKFILPLLDRFRPLSTYPQIPALTANVIADHSTFLPLSVELNVGGCLSRSYDFNGTMGKNIHAKRAQAPSNPNVVIIVSIFSSRSMLLMIPPRLDQPTTHLLCTDLRH